MIEISFYLLNKSYSNVQIIQILIQILILIKGFLFINFYEITGFFNEKYY